MKIINIMPSKKLLKEHKEQMINHVSDLFYQEIKKDKKMAGAMVHIIFYFHPTLKKEFTE